MEHPRTGTQNSAVRRIDEGISRGQLLKIAVMPFLRVEIVDFVDEYQPGIVQCAFRDAHGKQHTFVEKIPRVTNRDLMA
jgi:hypothetical protein